MIVYGGFQEMEVNDLFLAYRLDLNTFVWSLLDACDVPPMRMLFCMVPDRANCRIIVFGGQEPTDSDDSEVEFAPLDAFVGRITAELEPTESDSACLKHLLTWRRGLSHTGPFPKDHSAVAFAAELRRDSADQEDCTGLRCFIFGGETPDGQVHNGLTELLIDDVDFEKDDDDDAGNWCFDEHEDRSLPVEAPTAKVPIVTVDDHQLITRLDGGDDLCGLGYSNNTDGLSN
jgi:hypothetical protein